MLLVLIVILAAPTDAVVQSLWGGASSDSCWVYPVALGVHLAVCGPLGCPSIVGGRDNRSDDSHPPYRNPRNAGNCCCGDDNRPLGGSRNRDGCLRRGSNRPPNRGCDFYICPGTGSLGAGRGLLR